MDGELVASDPFATLPTTFRLARVDETDVALSAMANVVHQALSRGLTVDKWIDHCTDELVWRFRLPEEEDSA